MAWLRPRRRAACTSSASSSRSPTPSPATTVSVTSERSSSRSSSTKTSISPPHGLLEGLVHSGQCIDVAEHRDRERLRETFGSVAELYDRARPEYPTAVFDDLEELAQLEPGSRVLEIGPGTGKATVELAERGYA